MGATTTLLSFEEFESLPDAPGKRELLDGELIELPPPKLRHALIQDVIAESLKRYAVDQGLRVFEELGFRLRGPRGQWLQPDVSVVARELIERAEPDGYIESAPLIAIEVISSGNTAESVERKLVKYLENGAGEVWVVYPKTRHIWRYEGLTAHAIIQDGMLTSPLLCGFELDSNQIFGT
jgi:Uma2 family endonuclease